MSQHVLIVEDEPKLAELLRDYFVAAGFECTVLGNGDEVEPLLATTTVDLVLLDLQLPGRSGLDVCRWLRSRQGAEGAVPIIMVTARVDEIDRLLGLELGADDYICKPFSPREVVARGRAVLRRAATPTDQSTSAIRIGRLSVDVPTRMASVDGSAIELTPLEFELLKVFVERPRQVLSRAVLLQRAKGSNFDGYERNMDTHVKNLRRKLKAALAKNGHVGDPFRTVYGIGYALAPEVLALP